MYTEICAELGGAIAAASRAPDIQFHLIFEVSFLGCVCQKSILTTKAWGTRLPSTDGTKVTRLFEPLTIHSGSMSEMAFHEKAGRSQVDSSLAWLNKVCFSRRVATVAMLPSALSRSDLFRSVHVGRSRFSRCCHLFGALWFCSFRVEPGPGH